MSDITSITYKNSHCFVHFITYFSQRRTTKRKNKELFGNDQKMRVELSKLNAAPSTPSNEILKEAAAKLGLPDYLRFKGYLTRAFRDYDITNTLDPESGTATGIQVCSIRYPDAFPRKFLFDSNMRCVCTERVADQGMCPHEIRAFGFDVNKFEKRHLRRIRVTGSLTGWTQTSEPKSSIDGIIGFEPEEFETSSPQNPAFPPAYPPLPPLKAPGFLPDKSSTVKPFSKKIVGNIFNDALAKYPNLDDDTKFELNGLALQIQSMLISDPMGTTVDHVSGGMSVDVPSQQLLVSQPKNRIMCPKEKNQRKTAKSNRKSITGKCNLSVNVVSTVLLLLTCWCPPFLFCQVKSKCCLEASMILLRIQRSLGEIVNSAIIVRLLEDVLGGPN